MKHISILAAMLLIMGIVLLPGCDEDSGNNTADLLVMKYVSNSKYYLRFDVDYDNDTVVDEHVDMRVTQHFDLIYYNNWYQAMFTSTSEKTAFIYLPDTTSDPITYVEPRDYFRFGYEYNDIHYASQDDHDFSFTTIRWDGKGGEIYAEFSGEISNDYAGDEKIVYIRLKTFCPHA